CGKVFKEIKKNTETDEFLKKEKEKANEKAMKLSEKKANSQKNAEKTKKMLKVIIPCVAAVLVLAITAVAVISNINKKKLEDIKKNHPEKLIEYTYDEADESTAIMKIGDINIDPKEYEFFYRQSFSNTQNNAKLQFTQFVVDKIGDSYDENTDYYPDYYSEYAKLNPNAFDYTKPITQQTTYFDNGNGSTSTWQEYIRNDAINTMKDYRVKYELAKKDGIELTDDIRYQVYSHIEGLREAIKGGGYQNLTQYLQLLFGSGCNEEFFKNELIREYIASKYDVEAKLKKMDTYSQDKIKGIYEMNTESYDFIDIGIYDVTGKNAESRAKKLLNETKTADDFSSTVQKLEGNTNDRTYLPTVPNQYIIEQYSEELAKWAYSKERKANDKAIFESADGYFVAVLSKSAYTTEDNVSYREIVINKTDENGVILTGTALDEARAQAQEIFDEIKKDKVDENGFACTALMKSKGSTASSGGFVGVATASQLDKNINDWVTGNRKYGDIELIETESSISILYFLKNYGKYWNYAVRATSASGDIPDEVEKLKGNDYKENYDSAALDNAETAMNDNIDRIYFGIGA
ncbi:MAG: peptidylprolyl isomerase, partial [Clostridia bacterium]|nr:peptidylprolyl isomerase [Clostridia bacterium]